MQLVLVPFNHKVTYTLGADTEPSGRHPVRLEKAAFWLESTQTLVSCDETLDPIFMRMF